MGNSSKCSSYGFWKYGYDCSTGVAFTRNPSTGENSSLENFTNAQGEDVVAGTRTPQYITKKAKDTGSKDPSMEEAMPKVYKELTKVFLNWKDIIKMCKTSSLQLKIINFGCCKQDLEKEHKVAIKIAGYG